MAVTKEQVAELYVAYFNRAPDSKGLDYWMGTGLALEEISSSFYDQPETKINYPASTSDAVFVNNIYKNVFNRDAEPNGLTYWENELANGTVTRANMILAIVNGAKDSDKTKDATILTNKTEIGLYAADAGVNDVDKATDIMKDVDATGDSIKYAKALADNYATLVLTIKQDTLVGTANDDTIDGLLTNNAGSTYTAGDNIDGGEGKDTLKLNVQSPVQDISATLKNVESVELLGSSSVGTISAYNWGTVDNYIFSGNSRNGDTIANINYPVSSVTFDKVTSPTSITLNFATRDVQNTDNDILDITLSNSSVLGTINTQAEGQLRDIYEELKIHSIDNTGVAGVNIAKGGDLSKVTVDGNSDISISLTNGTDNELFDASALTGKLNYISASTFVETIKGGSGDDTITAGKTGANIWGGSGKDTITGGNSLDNIKYGDIAKDSGLTTKTSDIVSMNSGTDTLSFRGLEAGSVDNFYSTKTKTNVTSVETAVTEANKGILTNKMYVEYTNANNYLVIDSNDDGKADSVITLTNTISYTDITTY